MTASNASGGAPHVVIVGAGIVGASIAFQLARRGAALTILDAGRPGRAVSSASMAWINAADKKPRPYADLSRRSLDSWDRLAAQLGGDVGLTWGGELRWASTEKGAEALATRVRAHQAAGYPIRLIDPRELETLEPALSPGDVTAVSFAEVEGHVDAVRVVDTSLAWASEHGAQVRANTPVTGLRLTSAGHGGRRVEAVEAGGDQIPCDAVVLAAGLGAPELAAQAGLELPLNNSFGAVVVTEPLPRLFQHAAVVQTARDVPCRVSIRQLPDGAVMLHGLGTGEGSLGSTDAELAQVQETAAQSVPSLRDTKVAEVRKDGRPVPRDGMPVLGFARAVPNLYLAVMHNAITLAPVVGELAAIEILDGVEVDLLTPYRIERFS